MLQPRQDRLFLPRRGMSSTGFSDRRDRIKCTAFLREINFGVALRGFETDMPEPAANQIEFNASLEEGDCTGVSKRVRVDRLRVSDGCEGTAAATYRFTM